MAKIQWTAKYQIFLFIVAEILLSEATPVGRASSKLGGKYSASKKPALRKSSVLKGAKTGGFLAEESMTQQLFTSPYIQNLISSHDNNNNIGSGWYGFQHFIPRQSRILNDHNGREESLYFLGEKRPVTSASPSFNPRESDHSVPQPQQQNYQYVQYDSDVSQEDKEVKNENALPLINTQLLRSPVPVTLRIIPLKMTSQEIARALQKMHWLPFPMSLPPEFTHERREQEDRDQPVYEIHHAGNDGTLREAPMYHDRSFSEPSYPPPSSHVATPLENPPAITYDRGMSFESYDGTSFFPRTFSKP